MGLIETLWKSLQKKRDNGNGESEIAIEDELPWFDHKDALKRINREVTDPLQRSKIVELLENGFVVVEHAVDIEVCEKASAGFLAWRDRNKDVLSKFQESDGRLIRIINLHQTLPVLKSLFSQNQSLPIQDYLFERETVLYTSLFYERGSAQPSHRDIPLFWTYPAHMYFGMWIALEDADGENGALEVVPGGHQIGFIDRGSIAARRFNNPTEIPPMSNELWIDYQDEVVKRCNDKNLIKKQVFVKKGDVILWHPLAPHGGAPIKNPSRTRLSLVVHTTPKGVPVFHMDVFFNPSRRVRRDAPWLYSPFEGRAIAETGPMSIGHGIDFDFKSLK